MKKVNSQKAFTLIELLVVIAIIGILSTLAIVALGNIRAKSRDTKRLSDIKQISTSLELYYTDNGYYPTIITSGASLSSPDGRVYMASIPSNPAPRNDGTCANSDYNYSTNANNSYYSISACLGVGANTTNAGLASISPEGFFTCGQNVSDIDGNKYNTIQIGSQCWMKENLNTGTMINVSSSQNNDLVIEKYCYNNNTNNCAVYGALYQWHEAMNLPSSCVNTDCSNQIKNIHQGICPNGWHVPNDSDTNTLEKYIISIIASQASQYSCNNSSYSWQRCADNDGTNAGGAKGVGKSIKKIGVGSGNGAGDDLVGFSALLAGFRHPSGYFDSLSSYGGFWESLQYTTWAGVIREISETYSTISRNGLNSASGYSVRCIKN